MAKRKTSSPACSACRVQRKKCSEECVLAPHFPPDDPHKLVIVQSVFGTSHIVKLLRVAGQLLEWSRHHCYRRKQPLLQYKHVGNNVPTHFENDYPHLYKLCMGLFSGYKSLWYMDSSATLSVIGGLKAEKRADAVNSMVYEATARMDDPVHGCAKTIDEMQKRISELQAQLAAKQEELMNMRLEYDKLVFLLGTRSDDAQDVHYPTDTTSKPVEDIMYDEVDPLLLWGPLWDI